MSIETQTSFVAGWAMLIPLLGLAALFAYAVLTAGLDQAEHVRNGTDYDDYVQHDEDMHPPVPTDRPYDWEREGL